MSWRSTTRIFRARVVSLKLQNTLILDNQKQQLKDLLPDFLALYSAEGKQPFVQLFQGPFAAREVYNEESAYLRQIRYLPEYVDLKASIYLYGDNIGVIATHKEGAAFIVHSPDLAFSMCQIFEFLWGISIRS